MPQPVRVVFVPRDEVPAEVRCDVPETGAVHLPRMGRRLSRPRRLDELPEQPGPDPLRRLVRLAGVPLQDVDAVSPVELVLVDDEDGVRELADEERVAAAAQARDTAADPARGGRGHGASGLHGTRESSLRTPVTIRGGGNRAGRGGPSRRVPRRLEFLAERFPLLEKALVIEREGAALLGDRGERLV